MIHAVRGNRPVFGCPRAKSCRTAVPRNGARAVSGARGAGGAVEDDGAVLAVDAGEIREADLSRDEDERSGGLVGQRTPPRMRRWRGLKPKR